MNSNILHTEVQDFINHNLNTDIAKLLFKGSPFKDASAQELVEQIESKKKSQNKLPIWFARKNIYYPNKLNIEQTSSEITANYKANLISGTSLIDLTGGFGVDSYTFSKQFNEVIHCDIDTDLSKIARHNFEILGATNIKAVANDGLAYLRTQKRQYEWIYIDPSRRNDVKGKFFLLKDCLPNVPDNLNLLFEHTDNIMIKLSPMLDITSAICELRYVKEVHVIAIQNEVKELLLLLEKSYTQDVSIKTINSKRGTEELFESKFKSAAKAEYSLPLTYLYEPNAAILKANLFNEVSHQLNIYKLHKNSHLYSLNKLINFPGRRFKVNTIIPYNKKRLKTLIPSNKANITTRNFPETVAQIRKKTGLKEGGDQYLFFTTDIENKHIVLFCEKV